MDFLTEVMQWIGRHQPVWPFPFICAALGGWWMGDVFRYLNTPPQSKEEAGAWATVTIETVILGLAAIFGLISGQWYFLVPLVLGALVSIPAWFAVLYFIWLPKEAYEFGAEVMKSFNGSSVKEVQPRKGPADFIRTCEDIVRRYRKALPADSIEVIRAHELADAKLEALRKLFALHERLTTVARDDEKEFAAIVKEANSIFPRVPLNKELVTFYESQQPDLDHTLESVSEAIESVYLSILHLPFDARGRIIAEVPPEYLRLQNPDGEDPPPEVLPDIEIPQRIRESDTPRPAPFPKLAQ